MLYADGGGTGRFPIVSGHALSVAVDDPMFFVRHLLFVFCFLFFVVAKDKGITYRT